jgi:hypothetical protein
MMEIVLPDGVRLRLGSDVGVAALRRVMTVLRGWWRRHLAYVSGWRPA